MAAVMLTSKLRMELEKTNSVFVKWSEQQTDWIDASEEALRSELDECRFTVAALRDNELQLEELREQNEQQKRLQSEETGRARAEVERLLREKEALQPALIGVTQEEELQARSFDAVHAELEDTRRQMERSLNDLTHGLKWYAALGLDFQRADGDCMKFIFTQIDRTQPSREFFFLMFVDGRDKYQLVRTSPAIDSAYCAKLLDAFNTDNDIGKFVLQMRNGFKKLCS